MVVCRCLHSLSRSVQQLRTSFHDHAVWKPLMKVCGGVIYPVNLSIHIDKYVVLPRGLYLWLERGTVCVCVILVCV